MNLTYNTVLNDPDVCGVDTEEFKEWLGPERITLLRNALHGKVGNTVSIDMAIPFAIFIDTVDKIDVENTLDRITIFKIIIEYIILFRHSANTQALAEYLSWYMEDEALAYNLAIDTERLFKELLAYINRYEDNEESLVPFHWDDVLNKLLLLKV